MASPVFCLMGPTASGKTLLACKLLKYFPFEIVSVDSAMIYRGMDIGTAKPDSQILSYAPHHLIDIIDPPESYSVASFCEDVKNCCELIFKQGKIPLLAGGTMMYFRALQYGLSSLPKADETLRAQILEQAAMHGWPRLHQDLEKVDPVSAAKIHPHDSQRIQRALEVYHLTMRPISELTKEPLGLPYSFINLMIMPEARLWLHQRIALRFQDMLQTGFLQEVEQLLSRWPLTLRHPSMRCVGYRQAFSYLQGEYDFSTFQAKGIAATRQLAKRQLTWLRHWPDGHRFVAENPHVFDELMVLIRKILDNI
ncbi:tRNA (adenosine(37)-N6)-dimethylallyltransferase MiaA [Legionella londiniensis]|uniref:tRNA dimethylallyltransferase n=1 Tax=Legionella londiniensis TaxID=45068 RepID=A0A0W0VHT7_9GAMM|nr:tRNA (adenosine(37)-N6)-dimethylallyltransferase MiaA [Legionella londiniensis]KTD19674.1 tRNA delta(2)-isopentenylpyrophosphate transferase [Legionella londiniensis]STX92416.1 tRNA delta(2)-isopentenylpyrophosphate transferase [Legionella londiniensis]